MHEVPADPAGSIYYSTREKYSQQFFTSLKDCRFTSPCAGAVYHVIRKQVPPSRHASVTQKAFADDASDCRVTQTTNSCLKSLIFVTSVNVN